MPFKSILKQSPLPVTSPSSQITSRQQRNRELALEHAHIIQHRKDVEAQILDATEQLLDFPSSPTSTADNPTQEDVTRVKDLIKLFQPSDFDSLVEERHIDGKCGYVLCPLPNKTEDVTGKFRIITGKKSGSEGLKVVEKQKLEQWCSGECGRRALYLRVQLSEEPAWTFASNTTAEIQLYGEHGRSLQLPRSKEDHNLSEAHKKLEELAIERGEMSVKQIRQGMSSMSIYEACTPSHTIPSPPSTSQDQDQDQDQTQSSLSIEGHVPKLHSIGQPHHQAQNHDDEDMLDTI